MSILVPDATRAGRGAGPAGAPAVGCVGERISEGQVVVNFGRLLALWTSGRIVACEHRVLSPNRERFSIPFFYEPKLDYEIAPLPLGDAAPFAPFA
jgi:isopenicillin N synthase-like dioxygenase